LYLEDFKISKKTLYERKKCLLSDDEVERKPHKKKLIIEQTSPITPEKAIVPAKKQTKKVVIKGQQHANKTKRNQGVKQRRLLIVDSDTEHV